jgi:hypothetical protein
MPKKLAPTIDALVPVSPGVLVEKPKDVLTSDLSLAPLASVLLLALTNGLGLSVITSASAELLGALPVLEASLLASSHTSHPSCCCVALSSYLTRAVVHFTPHAMTTGLPFFQPPTVNHSILI